MKTNFFIKIIIYNIHYCTFLRKINLKTIIGSYIKSYNQYLYNIIILNCHRQLLVLTETVKLRLVSKAI